MTSSPDVDSGGNRWREVVSGMKFVDRLNKRKSFIAAFGQRSLRGKVTVEASELADGKPVGSNENGIAKEPDVEIRRRLGNFVVYSSQSRNYFLEAVVAFNPSQFVRTLAYELCPPPLSFFVVLFVEVFFFGHTLGEARFAAGCRQMCPFFSFSKGMDKAYRVIPGARLFVNLAFFNETSMWLAFFATMYVDDVRTYIEPGEFAVVMILHTCRALVIASKYSLLPESFTSDDGGKMYTAMTIEDFGRTIVGIAWNSPKDDGHSDFLKMEMERASLEADVDLSELEIDVGSEIAARALRARASGLGGRTVEKVENNPTVVSGKELVSAIIDTHVGAPLPGILLPVIMFFAVCNALLIPAARGAVGMPMFGGSAASKAVAALHFYHSFIYFFLNLIFTSSMAWNFHRQGNAIRSMNNMMYYPGEPVSNFAHPPPPMKPPRKKGSVEVLSDDDLDTKHTESKERRLIRAAGEKGECVLVDLKDPSSCLTWSLVRRALRKVGSPWSRRLNLFSIVFLMCAFFSATVLLVLFYGGERQTHRLATSVSLAYLACVISIMVSVTVLEGSLVNDMVPRLILRLKRETLAMAAALASVHDAAEEKQLRAAHRLVKSVEANILAEEDSKRGSEPIEVFYEIPATPAAVTLVFSTLLSMLLIAAQRAFTMIESEGWSYGGEGGTFAQSDDL
jgi:hypothetical protein